MASASEDGDPLTICVLLDTEGLCDCVHCLLHHLQVVPTEPRQAAANLDTEWRGWVVAECR